MSPGYYFVEVVLYRAENGPLAFTYGTKSLSMNIILEEADHICNIGRSRKI